MAYRNIRIRIYQYQRQCYLFFDNRSVHKVEFETENCLRAVEIGLQNLQQNQMTSSNMQKVLSCLKLRMHGVGSGTFTSFNVGYWDRLTLEVSLIYERFLACKRGFGTRSEEYLVGEPVEWV